MTQNKTQFLWFPYMTISSAECARLSLLLPSVRVLEGVRPPVLPGPCAAVVQSLPVLDEEEERAAIEAKVKHFREFALLHGEAGLQSSMVLQWIQQHAPEDRLDIERTVKGLQHQDPAFDPRRMRMDAALFLEIARDLDEKESDLQQDYLKMEALEEDFRNILGIEEGETDDALEAINLSLEKEKSHLTVQLQRRMTSWLRLAMPKLGGPYALVTGQREPVDEILEVAQAVCARRGKALEVEEVELAKIPAFSVLSTQKASEPPSDIGNCGEPKAFQAALEDLTIAAFSGRELAALISGVREAGNALAEKIRAINSRHITEVFTLRLVRIRNCTVIDVWRFWDENGQEGRGTESNTDRTFPPVFLFTA